MPQVTPREDIATNVRVEMTRRRVDQAGLAEILGISRTAAGDRLRCTARFTVEELQTLAAAFEVSLESLLAPSEVSA